MTHPCMHFLWQHVPSIYPSFASIYTIHGSYGNKKNNNKYNNCMPVSRIFIGIEHHYCYYMLLSNKNDIQIAIIIMYNSNEDAWNRHTVHNSINLDIWWYMYISLLIQMNIHTSWPSATSVQSSIPVAKRAKWWKWWLIYPFWINTLPTGSMYGIQMLTKLGYIAGKCGSTKIWHTTGSVMG